MPLIEIRHLPAISELKQETGGPLIIPREAIGESSDIVRVAILNLMPVKERTERQLLRRLGMSESIVDVTFLTTESYRATHASKEHMERFYRTISQVKNERFDGLIITGAPIEMMAFEETAYWKELCTIMDWADANGTGTLFICWGAQAGLYHFYGVPKKKLPTKQFGIFRHVILHRNELTFSLEAPFFTPHSRHTYTDLKDVRRVPDLVIDAVSPQAGVYLMHDPARSRVFITGHSEYEADTLSFEYFRDKGKGLPIDVPVNYFPDDDPSKEPPCVWRTHSESLFKAWVQMISPGTKAHPSKEAHSK
ncbi:MAG: homoserine O-succinyltransferase [Firmicutes bacterium]|nr:homoserine O-succinyltransferase [Bacillota bacterium]